MGRLPAEVRAMTPEETSLLVAGWNEAHSTGTVEPMTAERTAELMAQHG